MGAQLHVGVRHLSRALPLGASADSVDADPARERRVARGRHVHTHAFANAHNAGLGGGYYVRERLCQLAKAYRINVVEMNAPIDQCVGAEEVGPVFDDHPDAVAVAMVHHDTTTGIQNDVAAIATLAHERNALCIVDAVSSIGGIDLPVDEWGVDICVTVANKCLGGLPGVAPISISPRAWDEVDSKETHNWYLNLRTWRWHVENWGNWHPSPTTVATSTARALGTALKTTLDEGLPAVFRRHMEVATTIRQGLEALGFGMYLPEECLSPVLTTVRGLPGMRLVHFSDWLREEKSLVISGGLGELAGKAFRVGHMGRAAQPDVAERFLTAVEEYLNTQQ